MADDQEVERAKTTCLRLLAHRARSEAELRDRLRRRGVDERVAARAVTDLSAAGLVNDREFAESWIRERREIHATGRVGLRWELRRKGVPEEIIQSALSGLDDEEELNLALSYVRKKLGGQPGAGAKELARLRRALISRGFGGDIIQVVMERLGSEL